MLSRLWSSSSFSSLGSILGALVSSAADRVCLWKMSVLMQSPAVMLQLQQQSSLDLRPQRVPSTSSAAITTYVLRDYHSRGCPLLASYHASRIAVITLRARQPGGRMRHVRTPRSALRLCHLVCGLPSGAPPV